MDGFLQATRLNHSRIQQYYGVKWLVEFCYGNPLHSVCKLRCHDSLRSIRPFIKISFAISNEIFFSNV